MNGNFQTRVLAVDDEPAILEMMTAILESWGCAVRTAADGFQGLKVLRETLPDIIISDLNMPNMSGFEFISVVRQRFPHIPVIAISGEFVVKDYAPGLLVDAFFQKGAYRHEWLKETMAQLIADSPIRPHLGKIDKAPVWIPRRNQGYVVVTCTGCLRSFSVEDKFDGPQMREEECLSCGVKVQYLVDSEVLKVLEERDISHLAVKTATMGD